MQDNSKKIIKSILIFLMVIVVFSGLILIINFIKTYDDKGSGDEFLFLLAGVDSTGEELGTRTDTMILVKANTSDKTVDLISIPRDSLVYINGSLDKINAAHSYGGIDLTIETVREFLDIDLENYLVIPFQAVVEGIDGIGGIDIKVSDDVANAMDISPGETHFNGEEVLNYLRFRKGYVNADLGRIDTQQDFLVQFIKEASKAKNIPKLPFVYMSVKDMIETNIPTYKLMDLALSFRGISSDSINKIRLNGYETMIGGVSYYQVYDESIAEIRNNYLYNYAY
ncbi:MAG: LCP family protein [Anaerococcus sp.]|nr:LCP family protein [Anaerococcus sp.]